MITVTTGIIRLANPKVFDLPNCSNRPYRFLRSEPRRNAAVYAAIPTDTRCDWKAIEAADDPFI
jgi:hypothetical protein